MKEDNNQVVMHAGAVEEIRRMRKLHLSVRATWVFFTVCFKCLEPSCFLIKFQLATLYCLRQCTRADFYKTRKQLSSISPRTFVMNPAVGRRRAAAAVPLHEVVLALVNASVAAGRFGVSYIHVISLLLHFI